MLELLKRIVLLGQPIFKSPTPLKILVLARFADRRGGADVYTESLTTQLAQRGYSVSLFCHSASPAVHACCQVFEFPDNDSSQLKLVWRLASWFYQRHWRKFLADHSNLKPDVIISSLPLSSGDVENSFRGVPWIYLPHSRFAPVEAIAEISESVLQKRFTRRLYSRWERWSILNASTTIRFTTGNETALRSYYDLPENAAFDIIPAPIANRLSQTKKRQSGPVHLLAACRLVESKNLHWLLQLLASLKDKSWQLTIAGDGPQRVPLKTLAANLGISDRVTFLGFQDDMASVYRMADLHLFPSLRESLGLTILEAMAFGVPTLAFVSDNEKVQTASDEIIEHGVDGFLAEDENDFRELLIACLDSPPMLLQRGESGRKKVLANHDWNVVAGAWESVLNTVVHAN